MKEASVEVRKMARPGGRGFPFLLALVVTGCLVVGVTGFASTTSSSLSVKNVIELYAKKTKEPPAPPRATRTLWKPDVSTDAEVLAIEKEIRESTKARLDLQRVEKLLEDDVEVEEKAISSDWQVSLAAGSVAGVLTVGTTDNWTLAMFALVSVYLLANGDPLEEQTPVGEFSGPFVVMDEIVSMTVSSARCFWISYRAFVIIDRSDCSSGGKSNPTFIAVFATKD